MNRYGSTVTSTVESIHRGGVVCRQGESRKEIAAFLVRKNPPGTVGLSRSSHNTPPVYRFD
jgi:hypothetical protein